MDIIFLHYYLDPESVGNTTRRLDTWFKNLWFLNVCVFLCLHTVCEYSWRQEEGGRSPEASYRWL